MKSGFFIGDKFYMTKNCEKCGIPFIINPKGINNANRFCSRTCYYNAQKGTTLDKKTKHKKHIKLKINGKNIYEHRYIFEQNVRPLLPGEIIHHKNEDKQENTLENLEVLSGQAKHLHEHNYFRDKKISKEKESQMINDFKEYGF